MTADTTGSRVAIAVSLTGLLTLFLTGSYLWVARAAAIVLEVGPFFCLS